MEVIQVEIGNTIMEISVKAAKKIALAYESYELDIQIMEQAYGKKRADELKQK